MQFIKLPKLMNIAKIELSELAVDWINTQSEQNINFSCVQNLISHILHEPRETCITITCSA